MIGFVKLKIQNRKNIFLITESSILKLSPLFYLFPHIIFVCKI